MLKSSILDVKIYQSYIKHFFRRYWYFLLVFPPVVLFLACTFFTSEIAGFIMQLSPPSSEQGPSFYTDFVNLAAKEILWISLFFFLAFALTIYPSDTALKQFFALDLGLRLKVYSGICCIVFLGASIITAFQTLEVFPNSSNEYAYLVQAEMFSRGKLWERSHSLPDFFYFNNMIQQDGIMVSRYLPGWPLFMSLAFGIGVSPAFVNPVLGLLALIVLYFLARKCHGESVAFWSLIGVAFTGYYVFQSASYVSHVLSALLSLLFVANIYLYQRNQSILYGLLAGFCLGLMAITRCYSALLVFLPFMICITFQYRARALRLFFMMLLGAMPSVAYFLWYNYSITGDPFQTVTLWAHPLQHPGFVRGHNFVKAAEHLARWGFMFMYWVSPGLLILYLFLLWGKIRSATERFLYPEDYIFSSLALGYFFYFQIGGNQYGPRFLFEGFPFLVLFIVRQIYHMRTKWLMAFFTASVLLAVMKFGFISDREDLIIDQRQDLFNLTKEYELSNAVVIVSSGTSPIRPMPPDDLTRNDHKFQNDVIYALDIPHISEQLMDYYPDRAFYKYVREADYVNGKLIKIK